ncbi:AAA family ATPase [Primorskyibacter aestuariivivens]|uniref:AAA family ATPase n=1 Tax=Primorskyibacter aestuariivivens TaxID=1888912 RepID=UPI00230066E9|nr:AAA family ATPase [Primorskyibacter aestuariivivens]MDA7427905.1 AAA family ATPase [Primorskyibacter aestuariivivens]
MTQHLRIANTGVIRREITDWAETEAARDILRSLDLVRAADRPALTMIAGAPGIGKTTAIKRFCETLGHDAIYIQAARGEGTAWNFAKSLASLWGYAAPQFNCHAEAREKLAYMIGRGRVLVVDEAQYLDQRNGKTGKCGEAFEWLRATAEQGAFHTVFCGDLDLPRAIATMPQLQSRLLRPVVLKQVSRADVAAMVEGTAFAQPAALDALHAVARLKGGLRNVERVTACALDFAGRDAPTLAHVKAAIVDMKLASERGL